MPLRTYSESKGTTDLSNGCRHRSTRSTPRSSPPTDTLPLVCRHMTVGVPLGPYSVPHPMPRLHPQETVLAIDRRWSSPSRVTVLHVSRGEAVSDNGGGEGRMSREQMLRATRAMRDVEGTPDRELPGRSKHVDQARTLPRELESAIAMRTAPSNPRSPDVLSRFRGSPTPYPAPLPKGQWSARL